MIESLEQAAPVAPPVPVAGLLNIDKPPGLTSAAVVGRLRRSSGIKRVGHGGTLDPLATGVLPIFFGRATVLAERLSAQGKSYRAGVRLGAASDTDDAAGQLHVVGVPRGVDGDAVAAALAEFVGVIEQAPPAFSAIKIGGRRSYKLARSGQAVALAPRPVRADALRVVGFAPAEAAEPGPLVTIEVDCGPGFYVRALARDLGRRVGTEAHLETLARTSVGGLRVEAALSLHVAEELGAGIVEAFLPLAPALVGLGEVKVDVAGAAELARGMAVDAGGVETGDAFAAWAGRVLAIGAVREGQFHPRRLVQL